MSGMDERPIHKRIKVTRDFQIVRCACCEGTTFSKSIFSRKRVILDTDEDILHTGPYEIDSEDTWVCSTCGEEPYADVLDYLNFQFECWRYDLGDR